MEDGFVIEIGVSEFLSFYGSFGRRDCVGCEFYFIMFLLLFVGYIDGEVDYKFGGFGEVF